MENKEIFKVGDTVYHFRHGKGEVVRLREGNQYPVVVVFDEGEGGASFTKDGRRLIDHLPTLSFTPYDLVNGGFSQERPLPDIEVDTLVYVREVTGPWNMRYFSHFDIKGKICCFHNQSKSIDSESAISWCEWSLTNPLEEQ